jgi:carbon storage regulator CsrA
MLVLTRKPGQVIVIGGLIRVTMLSEGPAVRLGIAAPRAVPIMRAELTTEDIPRLSQDEREAEMREEGSRRFVRRVYEPPTITDYGSVPPLDGLFAA